MAERKPRRVLTPEESAALEAKYDIGPSPEDMLRRAATQRLREGQAARNKSGGSLLMSDTEYHDLVRSVPDDMKAAYSSLPFGSADPRFIGDDARAAIIREYTTKPKPSGIVGAYGPTVSGRMPYEDFKRKRAAEEEAARIAADVSSGEGGGAGGGGKGPTRFVGTPREIDPDRQAELNANREAYLQRQEERQARIQAQAQAYAESQRTAAAPRDTMGLDPATMQLLMRRNPDLAAQLYEKAATRRAASEDASADRAAAAANAQAERETADKRYEEAREYRASRDKATDTRELSLDKERLAEREYRRERDTKTDTRESLLDKERLADKDLDRKERGDLKREAARQQKARDEYETRVRASEQRVSADGDWDAHEIRVSQAARMRDAIINGTDLPTEPNKRVDNKGFASQRTVPKKTKDYLDAQVSRHGGSVLSALKNLSPEEAEANATDIVNWVEQIDPNWLTMLSGNALESKKDVRVRKALLRAAMFNPKSRYYVKPKRRPSPHGAPPEPISAAKG